MQADSINIEPQGVNIFVNLLNLSFDGAQNIFLSFKTIKKNLSNTIPTDALQLEQTEKTNTKSKTTTKTTKQI